MLFHRRYVPLIWAGLKLATVRDWERPHAKPGGVYQIRTNYRDPPVGYLRATVVRRVPLWRLGAVDAALDGFASIEDLRAAIGLNGDRVVTQVQFVLCDSSGVDIYWSGCNGDCARCGSYCALASTHRGYAVPCSCVYHVRHDGGPL